MITFAGLAGAIAYGEDGFIVSSPNRLWKSYAPNTLAIVVDLSHAGNQAPGIISVARGDGGAFSFAGVDLSAGPVAGQVEVKPAFKYSIVGTLKGKPAIKLTGDVQPTLVPSQQAWSALIQKPAKTIDSLTISILTAQCSASTVGYAVRNITVTAV